MTFIGEMHDDAGADYLEAEILRRVASPDWALSMEMFERDVQGVVDEYLKGLIEERDLIASGRAWSNCRSDYKFLIEIAKEKHMPVIAANAPERYVDVVSKKGQSGLLALSAETRRSLYGGPIFGTNKTPSLDRAAALKMKESQCLKYARVTHPA